MDVFVVFGFTTTDPGPKNAYCDRVIVGENAVVAPQILMVTDDELFAKDIQNNIVKTAKERYGLDVAVGLQKIKADMFHLHN